MTFKTNQLEVGKSYDFIGNYEGNLFGPETRAVTSSNMALDWSVDPNFCQ